MFEITLERGKILSEKLIFNKVKGRFSNYPKAEEREKKMNSVYVYHHPNTDEAVLEHLHAYTKSKGHTDHKILKEAKPVHVNWQERDLGRALKEAKKGDVFIAYDSLSFARSASQILEMLIELVGRGVSVHFAKYGMHFTGEENYNFSDLIGLLRKIESDYVSARTSEAIELRRNMGVVLGRPKGRKNKALKLDKYKKEITRYLELSISKASIAKLVNCHPQTLYDWIERNSIPDKKPRKPRVRKEQNVRELA